jgi:hypothetical protein
MNAAFPCHANCLSGRIVNSLSKTLLFTILLAAISCGGGGTATPQTGALSGNWEIQLFRHVNPNPPLVYTGFLLQSGNNITGSLMFNLSTVGSGQCEGVGAVSGTMNQQNISLTINEQGEDISLSGALPSGSSLALSGQFSNLAGGCTNYANTGTWTATSIAPVAGSFHGTFTSTNVPSNGTFNVTGTMNQGPNTGGDTATLSGSIVASGSPNFCSYLSSGTITGLISGTTMLINLYGPNGLQITQLGEIGSNSTVTITPDATSITGTYTFPSISSSCIGDQGTFQLTFP